MDVDIYKKHEFECPCGKHHTMPIGAVAIQPGAAQMLPVQIEKLKLGRNGLLITDERIYHSICIDLIEKWNGMGYSIDVYVLPPDSKPDECAIGRILCHMNDKTDYLVSIGGGTVTDVVRYVAYKQKIPCVVLPSAMTMDGFFTNMSVIIIDEFQKTHYLTYPSLILADTNIIANAPSIMNAAGVGEVVSKISAAIDWYAAKLVKDIYYCDETEKMMASCIEIGSSDDVAAGISKGDIDSIGSLADALYRSAVAMAWYGLSACGSGAEHQLNHFWVMCQDNKGRHPSMHGHLVGVGAIVNMKIWEFILNMDWDSFDIDRTVSEMITWEQWMKGVQKAYGNGAQEIIELQQTNHYFDPGIRKKEIEAIVDHRTDFKRKMSTLPSSDDIRRKLELAGAPINPKEFHINREEFIESLYYAKESRTGRYNGLWVAEALNILEPLSEKLCEEFGY